MQSKGFLVLQRYIKKGKEKKFKKKEKPGSYRFTSGFFSYLYNEKSNSYTFVPAEILLIPKH